MSKREAYKLVAFYTEGTPYENEVAGFLASARAHGYEPIVQKLPSTGSWVRNAGLKPVVISALLEREECDLLYLDIDARIRAPLELFESFDADIGVHYRRGRELLSGTIYLANNPQVRALAREWCVAQAKSPDTWDQRTLQTLLATSKLRIQNLPASYVQIFDTMAHYGAPVIEHLQASRRYKELITATPEAKIPSVLFNQRVRRGADGCYMLVRPHKGAEAYLDERCTRHGGALKWFPKTPAPASIKELERDFHGLTCYVVGKGPSLDRLKASHFPDEHCPILAINEAVHVVAGLKLANPLFGIQQDARLRATCYNEQARMLIGIKAAVFYEGKNVYLYNAQDFGGSLNELTVCAGLRIALSLGAKDFKLLCFDAAINGQTEYARAVGSRASLAGPPARFLAHKTRILNVTNRIEWVSL